MQTPSPLPTARSRQATTRPSTIAVMTAACLCLSGWLSWSPTGSPTWSLPSAHAHPPPFFWMSDLSADRRVGFDVGLGTSELGVDAVPIMAASVFADVALTEHLSLTGRVPFVYAQFTPPGNPEAESSALTLGNAGIGVKLVTSSDRGRSALRYGLEGYIHLPTASDDDADDAFAALAATTITVPDSGRYRVSATTARLRGSARYEGRSAFLQAELGLDHHLNDGADDTTDLQLAMGVGIEFSPYIALLGELVVLSELVDNDDDRDLFPSLDVGVRYHNPGWIVGARVHLPFAEDHRDGDVLAAYLDVSRRF